MSPGVSLSALVLSGQDLSCLRKSFVLGFPCQQGTRQDEATVATCKVLTLGSRKNQGKRIYVPKIS